MSALGGILQPQLGVNMPITTRLTGELLLHRDIRAIDGKDNFFVRTYTTLGLLVLTVASIAEAALRLVLALVLLPMLFCGQTGQKYYLRSLVGVVASILTVPIAAVSSVTNIYARSVLYSTGVPLFKCLIFPWMGEKDKTALNNELSKVEDRVLNVPSDEIEPNNRQKIHQSAEAAQMALRGYNEKEIKAALKEKETSQIDSEKSKPLFSFSSDVRIHVKEDDDLFSDDGITAVWGNENSQIDNNVSNEGSEPLSYYEDKGQP